MFGLSAQLKTKGTVVSVERFECWRSGRSPFVRGIALTEGERSERRHSNGQELSSAVFITPWSACLSKIC